VSEANVVPEGFRPIQRGGPFLSALGPLYVKTGGATPVIGLRVRRKHSILAASRTAGCW